MSVFDVLKDKAIWVAWNNKDGRKIPMSPFGGYAKTSDATTWGTYAQALAQMQKKGYSGIGIIITDGLVGIDIDHCVVNGVISQEAQSIIDAIGSYAEISPSGTGVHVLAFADPEVVGSIGRRTPEIEVYNYGRYFTVTENAINDKGITDSTSRLEDLIKNKGLLKTEDAAIREFIKGVARDQARRKANETVTKTAKGNKLKYARVPAAGCTCGFCLMLASRGFAYRSRATAGELDPDHYHSDCKCTVVPGYADTEVEGYNPDKLYNDYYLPAYEGLGRYNKIADRWDALPTEERFKLVDAYAKRHDLTIYPDRSGEAGYQAERQWITKQVAKGVERRYNG